MPSAVDQMRQDWDERAREDSVYWVYVPNGRSAPDKKGVYEVGADHAVALLTPAIEHLKFDSTEKSILEIGCGIGRLFPGMERLGFSRIIGLDVSPEMIKQGREWCPIQQAEFLLVDGLHFTGIEPETVDCCFSYNALQHLPAKDVLWRNLEEMHRVLRPGGMFHLHLRGGYTPKERVLAALPPTARPFTRVMFRVLTLKWLRGGSVFGPRTPGHPETWELGHTFPQHVVARRLMDLGFTDIFSYRDADYQDGTRYWILGRKPAFPLGAAAG